MAAAATPPLPPELRPEPQTAESAMSRYAQMPSGGQSGEGMQVLRQIVGQLAETAGQAMRIARQVAPSTIPFIESIFNAGKGLDKELDSLQKGRASAAPNPGAPNPAEAPPPGIGAAAA